VFPYLGTSPFPPSGSNLGTRSKPSCTLMSRYAAAIRVAGSAKDRYPNLVRLLPRVSEICACKFDDWLVDRLHAFVRRNWSLHVTRQVHEPRSDLISAVHLTNTLDGCHQ
jgi:hypothetical protein